jgi:hypothetical protein
MSFDSPRNKEIYREFIDFVKCQVGLVVDAYKSGRPVEFESFSPYLADYNTRTGEIWKDKLINEDKIGLAIAKVLHERFPRARAISLYDEYNSGQGVPTGSEVGQIPFKENAKIGFRDNVLKLMKESGAIGDTDKEGENFLLISESSKTVEAEKLVERLDEAGHIQREGQKIYFVNEGAENPQYKRIILRTGTGRWLCEALDASTYLKPENLEITHLVVLSKDFVAQQDKVWEILRVLGIRPTHYHNIFYDKSLDPSVVAEIVDDEIKKAFVK